MTFWFVSVVFVEFALECIAQRCLKQTFRCNHSSSTRDCSAADPAEMQADAVMIRWTTMTFYSKKFTWASEAVCMISMCCVLSFKLFTAFALHFSCSVALVSFLWYVTVFPYFADFTADLAHVQVFSVLRLFKTKMQPNLFSKICLKAKSFP